MNIKQAIAAIILLAVAASQSTFAQSPHKDKDKGLVIDHFEPRQHCGNFPVSPNDSRWVMVPRADRPKQEWDCRMVYIPVYGKPWTPPKFVEYDYSKWGVDYKESVPAQTAAELDISPGLRAERLAAIQRAGLLKK